MQQPEIKQDTHGIEKMPTGIAGFDAITNGGLPRQRTTLLVGEPGCGKTTFALQVLLNGAYQMDEPGIFVALEENVSQIRQNAATYSWFPTDVNPDKLFFLDVRLSPDIVQSGTFDLIGLLSSIKAQAEVMGAKRVVFDSIDVLLSLFHDEQAARREMYRLHDWLAQSNLTGIVTLRSEAEQQRTTQPYGFIQFMADCVVLLHHRVQDKVSLRALRVMKYRGSSFAGNEFPMTIGAQGIVVAGTEPHEPEYAVFTERVSNGIARLDSMLNGGYLRGSSVLLTGAPGTAKSTLCGAFLAAACQRDERSLYVSFDEGTHEIIRNLTSVNIQLQPHVESGQLRMYSNQASSQSAEEYFMVLKALIEQHQPRCMVVDPLSAILKAGGLVNALGAVQRLIYLTKQLGITLVCTSLLESGNPAMEGTPLAISTIADTWIHLSYIVHGGERNRALSIVKSRGTKHSNQVRELLLSDSGVTLTDVYTAGGQVLMGTLRHQQEQTEQREQEQFRARLELKRRELEQAEATIHANIEVLQRELEAKQQALRLLETEQSIQEQGWLTSKQDLHRLRGADRSATGNTTGLD